MIELMRDLVPFISDTLNGDDCDKTYFTIVVWCDCCERPKFIGGNDADTPRTLKMLKVACDGILDAHEFVEGHA